MAFKVIRTARGKGKEGFDQLGEPEVLTNGNVQFHAGDSSLSATVSHGGSRLFVHLDESRGDIAVRPFGADVEDTMGDHGITGVEVDARLLDSGKIVARLSGEDDAGVLYRYQVVVHRPNS